VATSRRRRRQGIRFSRSLPRPDGAPLRRRRRGCGGGASSVKPQFRSRLLVARRLVSSLASVVEDGATAQGPVVLGRVDLRSVVLWRQVPSPASLDPGALVLGACPRPMLSQRLLHLALRCECLLRLFQSLAAMGLQLSCGWRSLASGDGRRRRTSVDSACTGSRDLVVIVLFSGACVLVCRISYNTVNSKRERNNTFSNRNVKIISARTRAALPRASTCPPPPCASTAGPWPMVLC